MIPTWLGTRISSAVAYLFKSNFPAAVGQPIGLANGVTYTAAEGWIDVGTLAITELDGSLRINGDALDTPSGQSTVFWGDLRAVATPFTPETGRVFKADWVKGDTTNDASGIISVGDSASDNGRNTSVFGFYTFNHPQTWGLVGNDNFQYFSGDVLTQGQRYMLYLVIDATNKLGFIYIEGGTEYLSPSLIIIHPYNSAASTFYPMINFARGPANSSSIAVTDTLLPGLVTPKLHDSFTRVSADLEGSTPDVANSNGDTWHNVYSSIAVQSDGDEAFLSSVSATLRALRIDYGNADHTILANVWAAGSTQYNDHWIAGRVADLDDNGFPNRAVSLRYEYDTAGGSLLLTEATGGSEVIIDSETGVGLSSGTEHLMSLILDGTDARGTMGTRRLMNASPLADTTATNVLFAVGCTPAGALGSTCREFKVFDTKASISV